MFVGQERVKRNVEELVGNSQFPQFSMIVGGAGAGRSTLVKHLSKKLEAQIITMESLKVDDIREVITGAGKLSGTLIYYLKNADELTPQAENALLKLTEEPPKNCYIIMSILDTENVLPTILSRGKVFRLDPYTKAELKQFTDDELILNCASNIGEVKVFEDIDCKGLYDFAYKVLINIGKVSTLNSLNIYKQIQLKDGEAGYPTKLFFNMLMHVCIESIKNTYSVEDIQRHVQTVRLILEQSGSFRIKGANKLALFDIFILDLRKIWRVA